MKSGKAAQKSNVEYGRGDSGWWWCREGLSKQESMNIPLISVYLLNFDAPLW